MVCKLMYSANLQMCVKVVLTLFLSASIICVQVCSQVC